MTFAIFTGARAFASLIALSSSFTSDAAGIADMSAETQSAAQFAAFLARRPVDALRGRGEILPEAPRCHAGLSCLIDGRCGNQPLCTVEYPIGPDMAFVREGSRTCRYHFDFGGGHVCNCPIRMALHRLAGIASPGGRIARPGGAPPAVPAATPASQAA
jgi:hypothetical protein